MTPFSFHHKLVIVGVLCAVFASSSASEDSEKPRTLLDDIDEVIPGSNGENLIRSKRWGHLFGKSEIQDLRWGTNWCLDQRTNPDDYTGLGLYKQSDECCRQHVKCTKMEKEALLKLYPDMANEINRETFRSCVCDEELYDCLRGVRYITFKAKKIGRFYFQTLARTCRDVELKKVDNLYFDM